MVNHPTAGGQLQCLVGQLWWSKGRQRPRRACYPAAVKFEWDPRKAASNLRNHGVSFGEATTVFGDPLARTFLDPDHSQSEQRELTFGTSSAGRALVVAHCERNGRTRLISARLTTRKEKRDYEESNA